MFPHHLHLRTIQLALPLINNAQINKRLIIPIIFPRALTGHRCIAQRLGSPVRITPGVFIVRIEPCIQVLCTVRKRVVAERLDGPLADESGELAVAGERLCVGAQQRRDVVGVAGAAEVVVVLVEDDVAARGEVAGPEGLAFEAALQHDGDFAIDGFDAGDDGVEEFEDPGCAVVGEGGGRAEFGEVVVVGGLVDGREGVRLGAS